MDCFRCGADDHLYRDCPQEAEVGATTSASDRPAWCGGCDPHTRLIDHGTYAQRCPQCWAWPAKGTHAGQPLPQHKRCGGCRRQIYAWDSADCERHLPITVG